MSLCLSRSLSVYVYVSESIQTKLHAAGSFSNGRAYCRGIISKFYETVQLLVGGSLYSVSGFWLVGGVA